MCLAKFAMTVIMKGSNDNKCAENKVKHSNVVYRKFARSLMLKIVNNDQEHMCMARKLCNDGK